MTDVSGALEDPFGLAGTLLEGQYRADAVVGQGGFGVVYRGRHLSLDQPIAIKVLKGLDGGDPTINTLILEKFRAEARLLYTLSQSSLHIVRALDFGATTMPSGVWAPFMILEWLEGQSLADDLADRRRHGMRGRSVAEALAILEPVADGLAAAHHRHVAHRDIKPANIFLLRGDAHGRKGPQVKVLDFGIAKIMKEGEAAGTKGTFASFTWLYAAPEQLDPRLGTTGLATDVYGFGLLVTELLTDRAPIEDRDVVSILKTATNPNRRPTPRNRGANVPDEIEAVCLRALAVDPKRRFATISEMWAALITARDGRGVTAMQPAVPPSVVMAPSSAPSVNPPPLGVNPMGRASLAPSGPTATRSMPAASHAFAQVPPLHPRVTAVPISAPVPMTGPPPGTLPPGFTTSPPGMLSPPIGTPPPNQMGPPIMPYAASPPIGTLPPGHVARRASPRADGTNPIVIVTIVLFVFAVLFAGTCAVVQAACGAQ